VVSAGDQGEAEVEQAYLNYQFSDAVNVKAACSWFRLES